MEAQARPAQRYEQRRPRTVEHHDEREGREQFAPQEAERDEEERVAQHVRRVERKEREPRGATRCLHAREQAREHGCDGRHDSDAETHDGERDECPGASCLEPGQRRLHLRHVRAICMPKITRMAPCTPMTAFTTGAENGATLSTAGAKGAANSAGAA